MEDVFRKILELSITGGGVILIIIFIRLFLGKYQEFSLMFYGLFLQ